MNFYDLKSQLYKHREDHKEWRTIYLDILLQMVCQS